MFFYGTWEEMQQSWYLKKGGNSHNGTTSEEQERPMQLAYYFWVLGDTLCHQVTEAQHFNI
jgi:hypothetical protein